MNDKRNELFGNRESMTLWYVFLPLSLIPQSYPWQTKTNSFKKITRTDTSIALTCHAVVVGFFFSSHLLYQSKCIMKVRILCPPIHSTWQRRDRKIHILLPHKKNLWLVFRYIKGASGRGKPTKTNVWNTNSYVIGRLRWMQHQRWKRTLTAGRTQSSWWFTLHQRQRR